MKQRRESAQMASTVATTLAFPTALAADPTVSVLAHYKREKPAVQKSGSLIAVSPGFHCYSLKNGLIRCIHRATEASTLLRGLGADVADMRFCRAEELVAAISVRGVVIVWKLSASDGAVG